jgi:hypothetical protein
VGGKKKRKGKKKNEIENSEEAVDGVVSYTKWGCMSEVVRSKAENAFRDYHMGNLNKGDAWWRFFCAA